MSERQYLLDYVNKIGSRPKAADKLGIQMAGGLGHGDFLWWQTGVCGQALGHAGHRAILWRAGPKVSPLFLREEILVQPLELQHPAGPHAHTMLDHQAGEALTIDQDDALGDAGGEFHRWRRECRGGDEDAL